MVTRQSVEKYSSSKTFPVNMHHRYIYPMVAGELMAVCACKILLAVWVQCSYRAWYVSVDHQCDNSNGTHFFTPAGSEVEMKDKWIQTETSETEHKDVQVGSIVSPPESMHFSCVYVHIEIMHAYQSKL